MIAKVLTPVNDDHFEFKGVLFDDVVSPEESGGENHWSTICKPCLEKHPKLKKYHSGDGAPCICGVAGCENTDAEGNEHMDSYNPSHMVDYIDFPNEEDS